MSLEGRHGTLGGQAITLRVLVLDELGCPRAPDALPEVYIYDPSVDIDTIEAEIEAETYTSALAGPLVPTLVSTGYYSLTYTVPSGAEAGVWHDVWVGALDTATIANMQSFTVIESADFSLQTLLNNEMVIIELDTSIASAADSTITLEDDTILSFTTVFNPFYASVELTRMEAGPIIDYIPSDTLALMIYWASREVDYIKPKTICSDRFDFWKTKFVIADATLRALMLPGGAYVNGYNTGNSSAKALGELSIKQGTTGPSSIMSGGIDKDTFDYLKKLRDEFWRVVNAGGCINPGQSLGFIGAQRGLYDPARRGMGRLWVSPDEVFYSQPTTNAKVRKTGQRMKRFGNTSQRPRHYIGKRSPQHSYGEYYYG